MDWLLRALTLLGAILLWGFHQLMALFLTIYLGMALYYWQDIRPNDQAALVSAQPYLSNDPEMLSLRTMAIKIHSHAYGFITYTIRPSTPVKKQLYRHVSNAVWTFWLTGLYSDDELYAMMLSKAYFGQDIQGNAVYGAREAAQALFHIKLEDMTCEQRLQLVYMLKGPSHFRPGSPRLIEGSRRFIALCE
ncbi:penicillin-binding protein, 1A family [Leminorella richardii]|uniref:Penicillin-binding protein, 1A family n=1 Tax=Leminorella richardii TaxID=158841 RepID=A0A2X4UXE1_9GAMM|nr:transglycosylase domain-containing protein [Leminorella richardii]SQI40428.1 penicillin-binding protein, 1A family [Leminorella richardii]